jgi:hypothetical protein
VFHSGAGLFRILEPDVQFRLGITPAEGAQNLRQAVQADMVTGAQLESTRYVQRKPGKGTPAVFHLRQDAPEKRQQSAPGLGQVGAPTDAVEQRDAEMRLQGGHALAHRRLGQM